MTTMRGDGWQHCQKCPPKSFCTTCSRVNRERHNAGLIYGYGDPRLEPSEEALALTILQGKYRGHRPDRYHPIGQPVVTAYIKRSGSWRRGAASLNGKDIYVQPKATRSLDDAWAYARERAELVRMGLEYEAGL